MKVQLACFLAKELLEQNTFSEKDQRKLERLDRKDKDGKFVNKINQEVGEFFEELTKTGDVATFMNNNNIKKDDELYGGHWQRFPFYKEQNGKLVQQPLVFGSGYESRETAYSQFIENNLQSYINQYNGVVGEAADAAAQLSSDIAHNPELGMTKHAAWALDNTDAIKDASTQRDMKKAEKRANKFEAKRQERLLDLLDDQEDAIVDTIRDHLKTNNPDLNKRQRKVFADMLFDVLYSYDDIAKVPDTIELTHAFKNLVTIQVQKTGVESIFTSVQTYKTDYHAERGLTGDKRASRFQRKFDAAEQSKQDAFGAYVDLLQNTTSILIDNKPMALDDDYRTAILLSDLNFDGALRPAKDLADGEFKRSRLGKILVEGVLRSVGMTQDKSGDGQNYRKYAKSFKYQPINNNLETEIGTAREVARARKGKDVVETNLKALLQKGFGETAIDVNQSLYDLLQQNSEYSMFLKRIFIMEPDILIGLFELGPKALDIKYEALRRQQERTQVGVDMAKAKQVAEGLMNDPEAKKLALEKINGADIAAVKSELITLRDADGTPEEKKKELDKLIKGLDKPENRDKLRWQLASGGLMAMIGAQYRERHQVIYTYDNQSKTPILADASGNRLPYDQAYNADGTPKPGTQPTNTYEDANSWKDKLKRTNFSYGLGTGGTLLAESDGSYKQSVTYGISALYSDFATSDPSQQKDGFSFGLSFGYNGTQGLGQLGTSNSYKANINFGVGVGVGADTEGNFVFGPYVYLSPDVLLNGGKLTHTLDAKGALRLRAGVSGSLNKGLLSFVPNMGLSNDRIEGYTIIEDNLKNKVGPIFENILLGLKGRDLNTTAIQAEMEKMYADVVMGIDKRLGKSKPKNMNKAAKLLASIMSVYAGSDVTQKDDYESYVKNITPELATVFANQWWNENIEAVRGRKITSVNVGSVFILALFGFSPLSIAAAILGTVGTTAYGRAVAENEKKSLAEAQENIEQNYSSQKVDLDPVDPNTLGLGNAVSVNIIKNTLISKYPNIAEGGVIDTLVTRDANNNLKLHKDVASKIEVRIAKTFTVGDNPPATYNIDQYLKTDSEFLIIPADIAGGISELVDKNTRKTILTIGVPVGEPITDTEVWDGAKPFTGNPDTFNGTGEVALADLNTKLQSITVNGTTPLVGMSFDYDATSGILTLNKAGTTSTQVATYTQKGLLGSDKLITISKGVDGAYTLAVTDHGDTGLTGLKIEYKETTNVVKTNFDDPSKLNFTNAAYEGLFDESFVNQFADAKLLRSIMRGKYHKIYNAFNAAMVTGDYATAKTKAEALLGSLQHDGRIQTTLAFSDIKNTDLLAKQLFRFEALLIYSNACYCDDLHGDAGEVDFSKFVFQKDPSYKQFDGLMKIRKAGFARRVEDTFPTSQAELTTTRNAVADKLSGIAKNNGQRLGYARRDGAVGLVFGYPEQADVRNKLESKIVYNPRVITDSITEMDIKDPAKNQELMKAFTDKMDVINGKDWLQTLLIGKVNTTEAKKEITDNYQAIYDTLMKGEERTGNNAKVDLDFSFFFYPNCANEGILLEANVAEKSYTATTRSSITEIQRGLPGPTGFWVNSSSVMQRAEVTAVNVGLTAAGTYTKDIPEYVTSSINVPESPTSIPQIHLLIDGQTVTIDLAPNNGHIIVLPNGQRFGIQFTGYDNNGVPQWNFNFLDDNYNTTAQFGNLVALKNSPERSSLGTDLQNVLTNVNDAYASQVTWINGNSTAVIPKYLTKDQIALQAVQWIDHDRKGMKITVTDRIRQKGGK